VNRNDDPYSHGEARSATTSEKSCGRQLLIPHYEVMDSLTMIWWSHPPHDTRGTTMKSTWSLMAEILLLSVLSTLSASAAME
jgi:hypothetical protein